MERESGWKRGELLTGVLQFGLGSHTPDPRPWWLPAAGCTGEESLTLCPTGPQVSAEITQDRMELDPTILALGGPLLHIQNVLTSIFYFRIILDS